MLLFFFIIIFQLFYLLNTRMYAVLCVIFFATVVALYTTQRWKRSERMEHRMISVFDC